MTIRHATIDDLDIITLIETASFHKTEAAKKEEIKDRLELNGDFFWLLDDCGEVLSFVHGLPTNGLCCCPLLHIRSTVTEDTRSASCGR